MFRIKICGVTDPRDASDAVRSGADAVGINFFPGSRRYVSPGKARDIVASLEGKATAVAVVVDESAESIRRICEETGIGTVQLHGSETGRTASSLPYRRIRTIRVGKGTDFGAFRDYPCEAFLLDAFVPGEYGGTGKTLDWRELPALAGEMLHGRPWILAGGLTPENVERAILEARPAGVDVASGVEIAPGRKDRGKMKAFVQNAMKGFHKVEEG